MPVKISRLMPLPMPRSVICSPSHMMNAVPAVSVTTVSRMKLGPGCSTSPCLVRMAAMPIGLQRAQNHGQVARPLRNLAAAQLAFLLDARQRLIHHGQKLKDDGRGNVGHNAQREDRHAAQRAAAEQVHQAKHGAGLLVEHDARAGSRSRRAWESMRPAGRRPKCPG